jgi:hemerythrin
MHRGSRVFGWIARRSFLRRHMGDMLSQLRQSAAAQPGEIFETLDDVLSLHADCGSVTSIVAKLDRLLDLTKEYFHEIDIDAGRNVPHLELHRRIIDYIANLRSRTTLFDRTRLLAQLRFLDDWLSAHISEQSSPYSKSVRIGISDAARRLWLDQP